MARLATMKAGLAVSPNPLAPQVTNEAQRQQQRVQHDPWRKWYHTKRWYQLRWSILVRDLFTCQEPGCGRMEHKTSLLVAHHREPHKGNPDRFWAESNLVCICKQCHDSIIQAREKKDQFRA